MISIPGRVPAGTKVLGPPFAAAGTPRRYQYDQSKRKPSEPPAARHGRRLGPLERDDRRQVRRTHQKTSDAAPSDADRLLIAAKTSPEAFGAFYDLTVRDVLSYFYRRVMCPHTAADLCAETFARALEHRDRFDIRRGSARGWLFGIAGNLHADWLRRGSVADRARRRLGIFFDVSDDMLEEIEAAVDLSPMKEALRDALELMSPALRDAVLLRVALDLPYTDVATRLGISEGAARVRVSRALTHLQDTLSAPPRP